MGFTPSSGLHFQWGSLDEPGAGGGWATNIDGDYLNDAYDTLYFPTVDLLGVALPMLTLDHRYTTESGILGDAGWVEALVDGTWERLHPVYGYPFDIGFTGSSEGWRIDAFDLGHLGPEAQLRLAFRSGATVSYSGWLIEEIQLHDGDTAPPNITDVIMPADTDDVGGPYWVEATIVDDQASPTATLYWSAGDDEPHHAPMAPIDTHRFQAGIEGQDSGTHVRWWIEASDGVNTQRYPSTGDAEFRVALPAPVALVGDGLDRTNRVSASSLTLRWEMDETSHPVREFDVHRDGIRLLRTNALEAEVELVEGLQSFTVAARFDTARGAMTGEVSAPLLVVAALPEVLAVNPTAGWPGEQLRLDLTGQDLYLSNDASLVGPSNVNLTDVTILDAHQMRAVLTINEDAAPGPVTFAIIRLDGESIPAPPFQILPAEGEPRVHSAHPSTARQGAKTTIFLELDGHFVSHRNPPTISMGDGVLIEGISVRGSGLDVKVAVTPNAPLGAHAIEVDDGTRVLTGAQLTITDERNRTNTGCSVGPQSHSDVLPGLLLMAIPLGFRRRPTR